MSETGPVTLELIGVMLRDVQLQIRDMRKERHKDMALVTDLLHRVNRVDSHVGEVDGHIEVLRVDLELMIRAELMGRIGAFETSIDHRLDQHEERIAGLKEP